MPKLNKTNNILIRIAIVVIVYTYIYYQVFYRHDIHVTVGLLENTVENKVFLPLFISASLLMLVNLFLESKKWQFLVSLRERVSAFTSIKAVFTGLSVSIFTPNRVGEFLGRVFFLEKTQPMEGIFMTVIGSLSQLLVTIVVGSLGLAFFLPYYYSPTDFSTEMLMGSLYVLGFLANIIFLGLYLNISFITDLSRRVIKPEWKHWNHYIEVFSSYKTIELLKVFGLSFLRYLVFSTQFYLFLRAFEVPLTVGEAMMLIPVIYLVTTSIPTIALSELGVRGSVSVFFIGVFMAGQFSGVGDLQLRVFAASTCIWLINIALPALIGTFFVYHLRFFGKTNIDTDDE
ncbi:MAG: lysylphosphatidylglycerol synthase transmembrane domain-containing protein [Bacteroidota bacterium]|nr:lysylphosphatidylglycerol synthase transmembrane domain-containing protein [Bacteroidota bacterium]